MEYVILAAGQGSRFVKEGEAAPKPMVSLLGRPMIGRLIGILSQCGASGIHIVTNPAMLSLNSYLATLAASSPVQIDFRPILSDNSFFSLQQACAGICGRFVAMTVDAIFPTTEFREYIRRVEKMPSGSVLMGLTRFVDDESPLYARLGNGGDEVIDYRYGGHPFPGEPIVSAGLYGLTPDTLEYACENGYPESLSDFQRILATGSRYKVVPFEFTKAFDVDCGHDRVEAERFLVGVNGEHPLVSDKNH